MGSIKPKHQILQFDTDKGIKKIPPASDNRHPKNMFSENSHHEPEEQVKKEDRNQVPGMGNKWYSDTNIGYKILKCICFS